MITLIDDSKSQKLYFIYNKIKSTHNNNKKKKHAILLRNKIQNKKHNPVWP